MKSQFRAGSVIIYCLLAVGIGRADELEEHRQCAAIDDDASRLACYDRTMRRPLSSDDASRQGSEDDAAPSTTAPIAPAAEPAPTADQIVPVAETSTEPAAPIESDPAGKAVETFGLPENLPDDETKPDQITAIVTEVTRRPRGEHVVVLDNGQVWEQQSKTSYFPIKPGDSVTIRKRRFTGYLLVSLSGRGYGVRRVR